MRRRQRGRRRLPPGRRRGRGGDRRPKLAFRHRFALENVQQEACAATAFGRLAAHLEERRLRLGEVEFANGVRGALDLCMFAEGGRFEQEITITGDLAKMEATVPGDVVWRAARRHHRRRHADCGQQPVHFLFIARATRLLKSIQLLGCGRQSCQHIAQPAQQDTRLRGDRRLDSFLFQFGEALLGGTELGADLVLANMRDLPDALVFLSRVGRSGVRQ